MDVNRGDTRYDFLREIGCVSLYSYTVYPDELLLLTFIHRRKFIPFLQSLKNSSLCFSQILFLCAVFICFSIILLKVIRQLER